MLWHLSVFFFFSVEVPPVLVIIQLILESQVALSMKMGSRTSQIKGRARRKAQMWDRQNYTKKREIPLSEHWASGESSAKWGTAEPDVSSHWLLSQRAWTQLSWEGGDSDMYLSCLVVWSKLCSRNITLAGVWEMDSSGKNQTQGGKTSSAWSLRWKVLGT